MVPNEPIPTVGSPNYGLSAKIEAVYVFPLSQNAAVDDMVMVVGDRLVRSRIARRDEARRVYENAKARGHVAGLLDQE